MANSEADVDIRGIVDIDRLRGLFDAFYDAVGISTAIIAPDAKIIVESGWQRICTDFHRQNPDTCRACIESNVRLHERLAGTDSQAVDECPHGMIDAAAPIVIDQRPVAYLHISQFRFTPLDDQTVQAFRKRARQWGFDEAAYIAALEEVPVISEKRAAFILEYLKAFTEMIADLGISRRKQGDTANHLSGVRHALEKEIARRRTESRRLNQILEGSPIPTFVIDTNHRVTHWNRACERLTGISADAIIGTDGHRSAFYDRHRAVLADLIVDGARSHDLADLYGRKVHSSSLLADAYEGEDVFPHLGNGGSRLIFCATPIKDAGGAVIGAIETIQDVTDRHTAEMALRASEARYRQIFDSANDGLFVLKEGRLVDCNPKALKLFGASRSELIGKSPLAFSPEIQPDGTGSKDAGQMKEALATEGVEQFFEWRFQRKDGSSFDSEVSLTQSIIADEIHLLAVVRDVSEQKRMMAELRDREQELNRKSVYLEKVNEALKASLDHREVEKRAVEESILTQLKRFVFPYLESLGKCRLDAEAQAYLNIIESNLNDVISQFQTTLFAKYIDFTPSEVRIADLIREGKDTKAIAALLGLSPSSVQWHRKNIRDKLGLTNRKVNLHTYLNTLGR